LPGTKKIRELLIKYAELNTNAQKELDTLNENAEQKFMHRLRSKARESR